MFSKAVQQIVEQRNPNRVAIRDAKLKILAEKMDANRITRIQYAAKYASTSNAWKKWQGETNGLKRLNAVEIKLANEKLFDEWVNSNNERIEKYGNVLSTFDELYDQLLPFQKAKDYFDEIVMRGTDSYKAYSRLAHNVRDQDSIDVDNELSFFEGHFKDVDPIVDSEVFVSLFQKYYNETDDRFIPKELSLFFTTENDYEGLFKIHNSSLLNKPQELKALIEKNDVERFKKALTNDGLFKFFESMSRIYYDSIYPQYSSVNRKIEINQKLYVEALLEKENHKMMYPDANLTMRVTYGKVEGYRPADGVTYKHYTTLDGIIDKDNPEIYDYDVPDMLKELYVEGDFGRYVNNKGELPVCFLASNHTTGGNSGSPVINAKGYLVGINFDRCWEGTMSDIMFDPDMCRNISLDMRYMLFVIDKFAGASYLLNEMQIVK